MSEQHPHWPCDAEDLGRTLPRSLTWAQFFTALRIPPGAFVFSAALGTRAHSATSASSEFFGTTVPIDCHAPAGVCQRHQHLLLGIHGRN